MANNLTSNENNQSRSRQPFERERRPNPRQQNRGHKLNFTEDFDFDEQNQRFSKEAIGDEVDESSQHNPDEFYNRKTSFFDNISSSAKEQAEPAGTSPGETPQQRRGEERKLNLETFGVAGVHHRGRGRGRGGRGFRGGRGRGGPRGGSRGRGGYNDFSRADGMSAS